MRSYSRWIFLVIVVLQVAWFCKDARDWCLWLPGLSICAAGLLADRRSHLSGNALFWIVCLVLYVLAPASQLDGDRFQGPISVIGIHFPDAVILQTVALADMFMVTALITQLMLRRNSANREREGGSAGLFHAPVMLAPPLAVCEPPAWPGRPEQGHAADVPPGDAQVAHARIAAATDAEGPSALELAAVDGASLDDHQIHLLVPSDGAGASGLDHADDDPGATEDNQVYILVDDPGEFRQLREFTDQAPEAAPPAEESGEQGAPDAGPEPDAVSAILQSPGLALAMVLISMGVPAAMYLMVGNLDFVTSGRNAALTAFSDSALGTFINSATQDLLVLVCLLGIERYLSRRTAGNLILVAVIAAFTLIVINPLNTARYQVGAVLIMAVLFACRGRFPMALSYAGIAISMYVIMPIMNLLRYGLAGLQGQRVAVGIDYNTLDYDCFSMFAFAVYRTGIEDFTYGRYLCSAVLFFLPRSWWPDKPRPSSSDLGQYLMQHHSGWFDNLSCPPMGDGYMDFGIAGVLCMGACFGYLLECSDQVIDRWTGSTFIRRGLAAAFVAFIPILLRGSLGAVMGFVIAPVALFILLWLSARSLQMLGGAESRHRLAWRMLLPGG